MFFFFFFSSRRRHTRFDCDWSSDVCSSDLRLGAERDPISIIGYRGDHMESDAAFSGFPHPDEEKQVMAGLGRVLRGAEPPSHPLRSPIQRSWARRLSSRVDPGGPPAHAPPPGGGVRAL